MSNSLFVTAVGYYSGTTGYNIHTDNFFSALSRHVPLEEIELQDTVRTSQKRIQHVRSLSQSSEFNQFVNLQISYGNQPQISEIPGHPILYTVWESTRLPDDWLSAMQALPAIWTVSQWGRQVMIDNGLEADKVHVIPEGVDSTIFNPGVTPIPELSEFPGFKFLHVGKYEDRKGSELLIRAFDKRFHDQDNVYLVLLAHNPFIDGFDINQTVEQLNLRARDKILCVSPLVNNQQVAALMTACDAAVFPGRAEGWGLPIIESMACGLPAIVTNYSAPTEYIHKDNSYLLNYSMVDIKQPYFQSSDGTYGQWAEPDSDHLVSLMEEVMTDPAGAAEKGKRAASDMHDNWQWQHAAEKAMQWFEENLL